MNQSLNSLQIGDKAIVEEIDIQGSIRRRFLDIGLIPGSKVECVLINPSGNPKAYMIRGALIAIRNEDACGVVVRRIN